VPKRLLQRLFQSRNIDLFSTSAPYHYVQNVTEFNVHRYININRMQLTSWCIVGGYLGHEIPRIQKNFPNAEITVFECSKRYIDQLQKSYGENPNVRIINKAVSSFVGSTTFYETSLLGSGSVLELGELHKSSYSSVQAESFEVESTTLDAVFADRKIDVLQIDVQGRRNLFFKAPQSFSRVRGLCLLKYQLRKISMLDQQPLTNYTHSWRATAFHQH
jgi:FkbM family methyltransferase